MKVPSKLFLSGVVVILLLAGCNSIKLMKESEPMIPKLDNQRALEIRDEAIAKYYTVFADGGEQCSSTIEERIADEENYEYYFCEDLDTKEKIKDYFMKVYSEEIINNMLNTKAISEKDGKLTFLPQDIGSMFEWDQAKVTRTVEEQNKKIIEFMVPDVDGVTEVIEIEFVYEETGVWKINTSPVEFM